MKRLSYTVHALSLTGHLCQPLISRKVVPISRLITNAANIKLTRTGVVDDSVIDDIGVGDIPVDDDIIIIIVIIVVVASGGHPRGSNTIDATALCRVLPKLR